jgi:hypothetical protein
MTARANEPERESVMHKISIDETIDLGKRANEWPMAA